MKNLFAVLIGFFFGCVLILCKAYQWQTIQDMFYFKSFHMYGILLSAILTGFISIRTLKYFKVRTIYANSVQLKPKVFKPKSNIFGGLLFGAGWAITGTCTAPAIILLGVRWQIGLIVCGGMLIGGMLFGLLEKKIPH